MADGTKNEPTFDAARMLLILDRIPAGRFVLSAAHGEESRGVIVSWVQRCSDHPPMLIVAIPTGHLIVPVVRDAHRFAVSQIAEDDRHTIRLIEMHNDNESPGFGDMAMRTAPSGAPIVQRALCYFDCELHRHVDIECDNELFIGNVIHAELLVY